MSQTHYNLISALAHLHALMASLPGQPAAPVNERAKFEKWFLNEPTTTAFERERLWLAWQACAATTIDNLTFM